MILFCPILLSSPPLSSSVVTSSCQVVTLGSALIKIYFKLKLVIASIPSFGRLVQFLLLSDQVDCSYMVNTSRIPFSSLLYVKSTFELIASDCFGLGHLVQGPTQDGFFQDRSSHYIQPIFYDFIHFSLLSDHVGCSYMVNTSTTSFSPLSISPLHHQTYTRVTTFHLNYLEVIRQCLLVLFNFSIITFACLLHFSRSRSDRICA